MEIVVPCYAIIKIQKKKTENQFTTLKCRYMPPPKKKLFATFSNMVNLCN